MAESKMAKELKKNFSKNLYSLMVKHMMTMSRVSIEFGLNSTKVKSMLAGKSLPTVPILYEMAEYFDVPMESFFTEAE